MKVLFISLAVIAIISAVVPVIAHLIPHNIIPETVLLIAAGAEIMQPLIQIRLQIQTDNDNNIFEDNY